MSPKKKSTKSEIEDFKEESHYLRGNLTDELENDATHFDENGKQILKFHGLYQQDDRDQRLALRKQKKERLYQFMIRSRIPGGRLTAEQYLVHDEISDQYADGTLRVTTRQGFQFHGILKGDIKPTLQGINEALVTSLGACGDLVRNVMCCPEPVHDAVHQQVEEISQQVADLTAPRTRAYHEVWLDGEKVYSGLEDARINDPEEPLYGKAYLPRKFKIAITYAGDNCVDAYAQDIGLIAIVEDDALKGFNVVAGGGLGMTHNKPETFPRLGDPVAFVTPEQATAIVEGIVTIHRDFGDRSNRKHARLKYVIHDRGLDWFKKELASRVGFELVPPVDTPPLDLNLHLGWHEQGDGHWYLGLSVENGRIQDAGPEEGGVRMKSGLREIVRRFRPDVRLTANHDVLLSGLHEEDKDEVEALLREYGIPLDSELSNAQLYSMACPALPTCGLALTESERALPSVIDDLEAALERMGLADEKIAIRMTGCPNGCARPYVADVGFVGRSVDKYVVFVGGHSNGTRLNQEYADLVPTDALVETVLPLFAYFKQERQNGETFGDFCDRVGIEALQSYAEAQGGEPVHA